MRPVVLDWGMAKTLPEHVRVGNAKIVGAAVWSLCCQGPVHDAPPHVSMLPPESI